MDLTTLRSRFIKGPGLRLDLDVRREWQCPECNRLWKTEGDVISLRCHCHAPGPWMKLIEREHELLAENYPFPQKIERSDEAKTPDDVNAEDFLPTDSPGVKTEGSHSADGPSVDEES